MKIKIPKAESMAISSLKPHPRNYRAHPDNQIAHLTESLERHGLYRNVICAKDGVILAGHGIVEAAKRAGMKRIPVVRLPIDSADPEALKVMLGDNEIAGLAENDLALMAGLLEEVKKAAGLEGTGYDERMLAQLIKEAGTGKELDDGPEPQIDKAAELQKKWRTARGQIWEIGNHRLMCGDCRDEKQVKALMRGHRAGLMNTDPPYGVAYRNDERPNPGVAKPRVANDELKNEDLQKFLEESFRPAAKLALTENAAWYMWHPMLLQGYFAAAAAAAAAAAGLIIHRQIIWVKPVLLLGRGHYHWKHELCFMGWVHGHEPPDYGRGAYERDQTTVWEIASISNADREAFGHSTPKPLDLFRIPIIKHLKAGEICYEPFAGSCPQLVAAEQTERVCYAMDIEPAFVAVGLQRMADMGLKPKPVSK